MLEQLIINGFISGSVTALLANGFALSFSVNKFFDFTFGSYFLVGAYVTWFMFTVTSLALFSMLFAMVFTSLLSWLLHIAIYSPLIRQGRSSLILLLSSLGLYSVVQNTISIIFSERQKTFATGTVEVGMSIFSARITAVQAWSLVSAIFLLSTLLVFLKTTRIGKEIRAVASDKYLARICAISVSRIETLSVSVGASLAAAAGALSSLDLDLSPTMSMAPLMTSIVAVILAGGYSIKRITTVSFLLGIVQHLSVWKVNSQWQDGVVYFILFILLVWKPTGFSHNIRDF